MKVILVHDWLTGMRGGERCLEEFVRIYPEADIYTMIHLRGATSELIDQRVRKVSFLQKIPGIKRIYRWLLPLYPLAIKSLKIPEDTDLVISLSHAAAKNISIPKGAKHISFCFTPMRYIWDQMKAYFGYLTFIFFPILYLLRFWDKAGTRQVDQFVAISKFVAARIRCFYNRESVVIYPPISDFWQYKPKLKSNSDYYIYVGALVPYKNVDQIILAFNQTGRKLKIVGGGPLEAELKQLAANNIEFLGKVPDEDLLKIYHQAKALIFAAKEDFGLIPIESLACGLPVIAAQIGALKESLANVHYSEPTITEATGIFYNYDLDKLAEEINRGVDALEANYSAFSSDYCVNHAKQYRVENFRESWNKLIRDCR